jgi:hypothetical protein
MVFFYYSKNNGKPLKRFKREAPVLVCWMNWKGEKIYDWREKDKVW